MKFHRFVTGIAKCRCAILLPYLLLCLLPHLLELDCRHLQPLYFSHMQEQSVSAMLMSCRVFVFIHWYMS